MLHCNKIYKILKLKYDSMFAPFCVYCKNVINAQFLFGTTL